jgi:hypothetical protein
VEGKGGAGRGAVVGWRPRDPRLARARLSRTWQAGVRAMRICACLAELGNLWKPSRSGGAVRRVASLVVVAPALAEPAEVRDAVIVMDG